MDTYRLTYLDILLIGATVIAVPLGMYFFSVGLYSHGALAWSAAIVAGVIVVYTPTTSEIGLEIGATGVILGMPAPVTAQVTSAKGECALGYLVGDTWTVYQNGRVSQPLCSAAAEALASRAGEMVQMGVGQRISATCKCPLGRQVTFELSAA